MIFDSSDLLSMVSGSFSRVTVWSDYDSKVHISEPASNHPKPAEKDSGSIHYLDSPVAIRIRAITACLTSLPSSTIYLFPQVYELKINFKSIVNLDIHLKKSINIIFYSDYFWIYIFLLNLDIIINILNFKILKMYLVIVMIF